MRGSFHAPMKPSRILIVLALLLPGFGALAEPLDVGAAAPKITATDQEGKTVDFGELYKKGYVLVYFYPKADTPGCTAEACSLRDDYEQLTDKGVTVVGVSADPESAQKAFKEKYTLPFTLIPDPGLKVVDAFGVPRTGNPLMGEKASRQSYLIKDGKVVWRDLKASTGKQAADVLAALKGLGD